MPAVGPPCMQAASAVHSPMGLWLGSDTDCTIHGGSITCISGCGQSCVAGLGERARLQATRTLLHGVWGHGHTMSSSPGSRMDLTCCTLLASRPSQCFAAPQDRPGQSAGSGPGSSPTGAVSSAAAPPGSPAEAPATGPWPPCHGLLLQGHCKLVGPNWLCSREHAEAY